MDPATLGVLSTIGKVAATGASLFGAYSQYEAGKDAEKAAKQEAAENIRRQAAQDRALEAEQRARAAASGVTTAGSPQLYMGETERQNLLGRRWMQKAGKYRAKSLRDEGTVSALGSLTNIPGYWT